MLITHEVQETGRPAHLDLDRILDAEPPDDCRRLASQHSETSAAPPDARNVLVAGPDPVGTVRRRVDEMLATGGVGSAARADIGRMITEVVRAVVARESGPNISFDVVVDHERFVTVTITSGVSDLAALLSSADQRRRTPAFPSGLLDASADAWGTHTQHRKSAVWFTVADPMADTVTGDARTPRSGAAMPGGPAVVSAAAALASLSRLEPSASNAAVIIAEAVAITGALEAALTAEFDVVAAQAAAAAQQAATAAAVTTAQAAETIQSARAAEATLAAAAIAETAARTVTAVRVQAQAVADTVAQAAVEAAVLVARSVTPGNDTDAAADAADAAQRVAATVTSAAASKAQESARAAVVVADAVAAAAAGVAAATAAAALTAERNIRDAAEAMRIVTSATAEQIAADTARRVAAVDSAARAAAAESGRLHRTNLLLQQAARHDTDVARALQEAMLTRLPAPEHLELAARYLTAAAEDQVGGDWYDAVILPSGATMLVIGDVVGHDIAAAAVMGQLRNLLRALVWDRDEPPSATVTRLDRAIRDLHIDTMATLVLISVEPQRPDDPDFRTLHWANAGHPSPLLLCPDGTVAALAGPHDLLLGVEPDVIRRDHSLRVPNGSTLLLYTDGLIETPTQDPETGLDRLTQSLQEHCRNDTPDLVDAVLADLVDDRPTDDVAALAIRFHS